jgi:hypothetical protein
MEINLYKVTTARRQTSLSPPILHFITIAESISNAESNVMTYLKGEGTVTSVSLLRDSYSFQEGDYYVANKKQD